MRCHCFNLPSGAAGSAWASQKQKNAPGGSVEAALNEAGLFSWDKVQDSSMFLDVIDLGFRVNVPD